MKRSILYKGSSVDHVTYVLTENGKLDNKNNCSYIHIKLKFSKCNLVNVRTITDFEKLESYVRGLIFL